MNINWHVV